MWIVFWWIYYYNTFFRKRHLNFPSSVVCSNQLSKRKIAMFSGLHRLNLKGTTLERYDHRNQTTSGILVDWAIEPWGDEDQPRMKSAVVPLQFKRSSKVVQLIKFGLVLGALHYSIQPIQFQTKAMQGLI